MARGFSRDNIPISFPTSPNIRIPSSGVLPLQPAKMTYHSEEDTPNQQTPLPHIPPLTDNHFLLPLPGARYAPRTLTFKGGKQELTHFLEVYDHVCTHFGVTDTSEKCKGITPYCTSKVARMIARLPSYIDGNYRDLITDLYYFLEDEDDSYNIGRVGSFTRKWRK